MRSVTVQQALIWLGAHGNQSHEHNIGRWSYHGGGIHQNYGSETQCISKSCDDCRVHCVMRSGIYCSSHYSHFAMSTPDCALHIANTHIVSIGKVESHMNYDNV